MVEEKAGTPLGLSRRHFLQVGIGLATNVVAGAGLPYLAPAKDDRQDILIDAQRLSQFRSQPSSIEVGFMPAQDFARDHIPGSVQLDWPALEVTDTSAESIAQWRDQVGRSISSLGISSEDVVTVYDAGTLFSARLWWILHYLGHADAHVLNGGLDAWHQMKEVPAYPSTPAAIAVDPATVEPSANLRNDALAQFDEVLGSVEDRGTMFVDARSPEEYAAGHIPGAVNINYPLNAVTETPLVYKPANELRELYEAAGVNPDKRIIPYCSSGVRSAVTFFTLQHIGYPDIGLYTGSWNEWEQHPDAPKMEGDQP